MKSVASRALQPVDDTGYFVVFVTHIIRLFYDCVFGLFMIGPSGYDVVISLGKDKWR